jgi:hypothetical protein
VERPPLAYALGVIRALRACLRDPRLRRVVGFVVLVAFVLVVALSASHAGEKGDPAHQDCGVCHAVATIGTSESFAAPRFLVLLDVGSSAPAPDAARPVASEPRRAHAPRGPPAAL